MYVLGIESTCDETAAAVVEDGRRVVSNVIATSVKEQALYGGVVPEIASRRHAEYISATVDKALADAGLTMQDIGAVAVTFAPGLIGAVLVGVNYAKGLAYAAGKPLGRTAAQAAVLLRGKHKPTFTPHVDCGDHVIIINAAQAILTGNKLEKKYYRHHTGYVGGLKEVQYKKMMAETPERAMMLAVKGMIPDTTIGRKALTRCRVYKDAEHRHAAQKPQAWTL